MSEQAAPRIAVITATKNADAHITALYRSLQEQDYRDFEWIVMDGLSEDSTVPLLRKFAGESSWMKYRCERDFGLYDAINQGIAMTRADYYVVAGADDVLEPNALREYAEMVGSGQADVVLANVLCAGRVAGGFHPSRSWLGHSKVFCGSHSVGMLFKRSLHEKFGKYSSRFPLLADGYFLKQLLNSKQVHFVEAHFVAGKFAGSGASSIGKLQTLAETWQIQMLTERFRLLQICLFMGKIVVRYRAIAAELKKVR